MKKTPNWFIPLSSWLKLANEPGGYVPVTMGRGLDEIILGYVPKNWQDLANS